MKQVYNIKFRKGQKVWIKSWRLDLVDPLPYIVKGILIQDEIMGDKSFLRVQYNLCADGYSLAGINGASEEEMFESLEEAESA
jgi:hypothetical protein